jgi:hypothetical protein
VSRATQLWRLLVVASVDPSLWAEQGTNERELVKDDARQLDGVDMSRRLSVGEVFGGGENDERGGSR